MVICGQCQSPNSPKAKFCAKCGVALAITRNLAETEPARAEKPKAVSLSPARANDEPPATPSVRAAATVATEPEKRKKGSASPSGPRLPSADTNAESPKTIQQSATLPADLAVLPSPNAPLAAALKSAENVLARETETNVQPLLAEEAKLKLARDDIGVFEDLPLGLCLNFPRALVAGYGSIIDARLENTGIDRLESASVLLESNALTENVEIAYRQVQGRNRLQRCAEISPAKPGNFVLRCTVQTRVGGQQKAFRGTVPITINVAPDNANLVVNISDIQCIRGGGANVGLGGEFGAVNISNLLPAGAIRTLNDLLNVSFPESFGKVMLELDYEVSSVVVDQHLLGDGATWSIPKPFLAHSQSGTKLKIEPTERNSDVRPIHLIGRDEFRIGRSRQDADFLTWFWPRSDENDERTKRLSKVHAIATACGDTLTLRDAGSANRSTFEGHPLTEENNDEIGQRGTLILGNEYHLDVTPFPSSILGGLRIANIRTWSGPAEKEKPPARGAVRFMPVNSELPLHNAVWILTDANFGCSRLNPIVLEIPGTAEVEGRFSYFRKNFWVETLETGNGITIGGYKLKPLEIAPIVNGAELVIAGLTFRATVEP